MTKLRYTLLVDDDQTTNFLNRRLLEQLSVTDQVLVALNGQEALDLLLTHCQDATPKQPVLMFLDINMPVMNGIAFLEDYQQLPLAHKDSVVIVLLTTSLHPHDVERAGQLPVVSIISKPLTKDKVAQVMKMYFPED